MFSAGLSYLSLVLLCCLWIGQFSTATVDWFYSIYFSGTAAQPVGNAGIQATPDKETYRQNADTLLELPHVADLHHLHFWSLDGEEHVLTVHLVLTKTLILRLVAT